MKYSHDFLLDTARIRRLLALRLERCARDERDQGLLTESRFDLQIAQKLRNDADALEGLAARATLCADQRKCKRRKPQVSEWPWVARGADSADCD